jgi:hypothetical protein
VWCTTLFDKVCQWPTAGQWFSLGSPISSPNKTDRHDIAEITDRVDKSAVGYDHKEKLGQHESQKGI